MRSFEDLDFFIAINYHQIVVTAIMRVSIDSVGMVMFWICNYLIHVD